MSLQELLHLVKPPEKPFRAGLPDLWHQVETSLGTALPGDYKVLVSLFGSGIFCDALRIYTPFTETGGVKPNWLESVIGMYGAMHPYFAESLYPKPGGLLPCAKTDNGGAGLFWQMNGLPDAWTMVLFNMDNNAITRFDCNITGFVLKLLKSEISDDTLNLLNFDSTPRFESSG